MKSEIITVIIQIIILLAGALIIKIIPGSADNIFSKTELISGWAYKFAVNAKNMLSSATGEEKKKLVLSQLQGFAEKNGISLSDEEFSALIEEAYDKMTEKEEKKCQ